MNVEVLGTGRELEYFFPTNHTSSHLRTK